MARGLERPPIWAVVVMVVGSVTLISGLLLKPTAVLSPEEVARINAQRPAATTEAAPTSEAPVPPLMVARPTDGPLRVMFAGDSLTDSVHASSRDTGFRQLMIQTWEQGGDVEAVTAALSGAGAGRVAQIVDVPDDLDLAVIELGTNDVSRSELADFDRQYGALLDSIRGTSPQAAIVCAGVWQPRQYGAPFDRVIEAHCDRVGGRYAPLYDLHEDEANRGPAGVAVYGGSGGANISDDFHPNDTGYRAIADRLLPLLQIG